MGRVGIADERLRIDLAGVDLVAGGERLIPTVRRLYAEGDTVIAFFDAEGTARDDQPYRNTYAWFLEMRDGRIVRANAFFDSIAFDELWKRVIPTRE